MKNLWELSGKKNKLSELDEFVRKYKHQIDRGIKEELEKRLAEVKDISPQLVSVVLAMSELAAGGKRMRGLLTILGYELAGGKDEKEIVKAAVVMELFHLGLLIQDDVMDRDELRRGVKTIHVRYPDLHLGEAVANCVGDLTFGWGMEIISKLNIQSSKVVAAMSVWGKYFARVGYGQILDVMKVADQTTLLNILALKSGEYSCVLPLLMGATLGGAQAELLDKLTRYGMELGWVFQLRDDWLADFGESQKTGKPVGNDRREGKKTLATMYGREKLEEEIVWHTKRARVEAGEEKMLLALVEWAGTREN
ncbi:MAG: hypothetical protein UX84_C0007G0035 [Microgenomates group bacterium GW2011_GWD1_47_13]|uniref:Polyprenyl synthetase n=1 Tax=Candidatus Collierbacteria bacterium RIFOXYA2_FULL_46_10 TaxID=1817726 RepID=A0A1F5F405_9BACT|nr:MAG: hypothetical protein UX32_C0023G0003 [Microgenomates group bacterium GW2011_GWF1_46_12]KKU27544.1 MAG: hypothetical protein UX40_C0011G0005 [Microgenomates group bacterium GW2011_GWF2_46_18]KKU62449.1 MAG: hypothetical protein UX84_C0007G0035 [Microgenomates group bacterium GW2011_GWD1_47_13]OGD74340.1 MAG: hypothetical protein A2228_02275 [Candidatus Collierbacteria bacterium RIFOXYA2_FULL_46_10]